MVYKNKEYKKKYDIKWKKNNPDKVKKHDKKYRNSEKGKIFIVKHRIKHKKQINTREKLRYLFRKKYLSDSEFICAICGKQSIEKHHENYDLPYVFIPLCKEHHNMTTNNKKVI